jgi:signal transduction histidine kinase
MIPAPRSLGGRAFVLIALLIVVSLAAGVILFCQAERTPLVQQLAQMVVAVNLTRAIILQLQAAQWQGRPAARFSVLDRGPGIAANNEEAAKRPFVRLDAARSSAGSGLGLAIVERAARLHGGELRLQTRQGGGLQATLTIPLT